jgi:hypothetical protein
LGGEAGDGGWEARRGRNALCKAEGRLRPIYSKEGGCRGGCGARGADARRTGEMSYQFFLVGSFFLAVEISGVANMSALCTHLLRSRDFENYMIT